MKIKFKKSKAPIVFLSALLFVVSPVFASEFVPDTPPSQLSYVFRLYYDNGQLFADRDFEFAYDVIPEKFVSETYSTQFPFKGEVINFLNQTVAVFQFDPRGGDQNFLKGKIAVKAPYIPDGQKAIFYDAQGRILVTIFVSESSFCNDDGVCNFDKGEDEITCPNDCRGVVAPSSLDENGLPRAESRGGQGGILMSAIYVLIIAGVGVGGWFGWKRYKEIKILRN